MVVVPLLMLQALAAVAQHKEIKACSSAREVVAGAAEAAAKQHLQTTLAEAEQTAAKHLTEATVKASGLLTPSQVGCPHLAQPGKPGKPADPRSQL